MFDLLSEEPELLRRMVPGDHSPNIAFVDLGGDARLSLVLKGRQMCMRHVSCPFGTLRNRCGYGSVLREVGL